VAVVVGGVVVVGVVVVTSVVVVVSTVLTTVGGTEVVAAVSGSAAHDPMVKVNARIVANRLISPNRLGRILSVAALDPTEHTFDIVDR